MDKNVALLLAPLIGGAVATISSYLTIRWTQKNKPKEMALERVLTAIETVELFTIKLKSGIEIESEEINTFIASCTWLPEDIRNIGFELARELLRSGNSDKATILHSAVLEYKEERFQ